jgi:hypothetical protein
VPCSCQQCLYQPHVYLQPLVHCWQLAAQERGEVSSKGRHASRPPDGNIRGSVADIGFSPKDIYESRLIRRRESRSRHYPADTRSAARRRELRPAEPCPERRGNRLDGHAVVAVREPPQIADELGLDARGAAIRANSAASATCNRYQARRVMPRCGIAASTSNSTIRRAVPSGPAPRGLGKFTTPPLNLVAKSESAPCWRCENCCPQARRNPQCVVAVKTIARENRHE